MDARPCTATLPRGLGAYMSATPKILPLGVAPALAASRVALTALVAFALIATVLIGLFIGISGGSMSWAYLVVALPKFLRIPTWHDWLGLACWGVLAAALFARGAGTGPRPVRTRVIAVVSGVLMPVGLVLFGHLLGRYWPHATGLFDSPLLTLYVALYGLLTPWLLGRVALTLSRSSASGAAPA
jgi:hypothetical protein